MVGLGSAAFVDSGELRSGLVDVDLPPGFRLVAFVAGSTCAVAARVVAGRFALQWAGSYWSYCRAVAVAVIAAAAAAAAAVVVVACRNDYHSAQRNSCQRIQLLHSLPVCVA